MPPRCLQLLATARRAACGVVATFLGCADGQATTPSPPLPPPGPPPVYVPGQSYFGDNDYIEYIAGNAPVILTAPHGGADRPTALPTRGCGTNVRDTNTQETVRALASAYHDRFGRYPHVVINRLHRDRLDANRDSLEASCGNRASGAAWREFHAFIDLAKARVGTDHGRGFLVDLHGHGHAIQRIELGYLLPGSTLDVPDSVMDRDASLPDRTSIRQIARSPGSPLLSTLLRGPSSLGTLLATAGYPAVPSRSDPGPMGADYFTGGYITDRHGCRNGGVTCAVQVEAYFTGVRDSDGTRAAFAGAFIASLAQFLRASWGLDLAS
ncbi:MAG: hypothetical protein IPK85_10195 [Gemmatimonadetes bacterium]|nr:hypothetical protein [Gemmatimonadota bacterium]